MHRLLTATAALALLASTVQAQTMPQRRLTDAEFAALDAIRITVLNRPADWATSSAAPWPTLRGFVRPVLDYDAAGEINLLDPAFAATLGAIAATTTAFGSTPEDQAARIAVLLSTGA